MNLAALIVLALAVVPVVLLISTTGCAQIAGVELPKGITAYENTVRAEINLESYWRLDDSAGASQARDTAPPPAYHGNYVGAVQLGQDGVLVQGRNTWDRRAALFNGGYVEVPFASALTPASLTIELWFKLLSGTANSAPDWFDLVGCHVPHGGDDTHERIDRGYRIRIQTWQPVAPGARQLRIQGVLGNMVGPIIRTSVDLLGWHYVALTYRPPQGANDDNIALYLDGTRTAPPYGIKGKVALLPDDGQHLRFGATRGPTPRTYRGLLDEVALYTQAPPYVAVDTHYNLGKP